MNEDTLWLQVPAAVPNYHIQRTAEIRQKNLTKPPGSLSDLEQIAIKLAALQSTKQPCIDKVNIIIFAADHGVVTEGISTLPQSVTAEMLKNVTQDGAAINVLADNLEVINLGTVTDLEPINGVINSIIGPCTSNFCQEPAMSREQLSKAINVGRQSVQRIKLSGTQLFVAGEINIENTIAATAMTCALLDIPPEQLAGPGTCLNRKEVAHKTRVILQALEHHKNNLGSPLEILRRLGGFEIAALTGSYLCSAHMGLPILINGFTSSVAALTAARLCPGAEQWFLFSHASAEPGHKRVLDALDAKPLLELNMCLGEDGGTAITISRLRMACAMLNEMVIFTETVAFEKYA